MADGTGFTPRVTVNAPAILVDREGKDHTCTLLDLSADGFRARLAKASDPRALVTLVSGTESYNIEVRWSSGLELGGRLV